MTFDAAAVFAWAPGCSWQYPDVVSGRANLEESATTLEELAKTNPNMIAVTAVRMKGEPKTVILKASARPFVPDAPLETVSGSFDLEASDKISEAWLP